MRKILLTFLLGCAPVAAQEIPIPTALPSQPFFVKGSWFIGGLGSWDYLTLDPGERRLYIAHGARVQVVDVDSGSLVGEILGFREAHAIALDDQGQYGFVSDGPAAEVKVFDRRRLVVVSDVAIHCNPRSIAYEIRSKVVFAICGGFPVLAANQRGNAQRPEGLREDGESASVSGVSQLIAIDSETKTVLASVVVGGEFRFAQPGGDGRVFISVGPAQHVSMQNGRMTQQALPPRIAKLDAQALVSEAHRLATQSPSKDSAAGPVRMDWSVGGPPASIMTFLPVNPSCANLTGLAIDSRRGRLFGACDAQQLIVINSENGEQIATLLTGPGDSSVGYDPERQLIFTANGYGYGSLTVVRQNANTDTYDVVQNLPTRERARTLAVDPSTGNVYLVTDFQGVDIAQPGRIGTMKYKPVAGSFQVLVVGR